MRNIRAFSVFMVATAASVWASGALAGGGGGYALVCNSVSPTEGCSIRLQQQININIVFEQTEIVNNYNILDQEILNPSAPQQVVSQPTQQQYAPAQPQYAPTQQQYAPERHAPERQQHMLQQQYAPPMREEGGNLWTQSRNKESERYVEARPQNRQMETAYPLSDVKVKEFEEIKPGYAELDRSQVDHSLGDQHSRSRDEVETIVIDSIVTLLGRL